MADRSRALSAVVVGLGWPGRQQLDAYSRDESIRIAAVCDPNAKLLEQVADMYDVEARYPDYREMILKEKPDVVGIATPNHLHAQPAVFALDHGSHVLVEKPMSRTEAEATTMMEAARRNDRVLDVIFNQRYRPDVQVVKRFVDDGGIGDIYHAKSRWLRRSGIPGDGATWFISRERAGGGPLIDLGVHMLDMALYMLGEPEVLTVSGATSDRLGQRFSEERHGPGAVFEVEDFATALIRLAGGRTLELEASWASYREDGDLMNLVLLGDRGGAEMRSRNYDPVGAVTFYVDAGGVPAEVRPEVPTREVSVPGHARAVEEFLSHVRKGNWADHRGEEGLTRTRIIDAIYRSAKDGREVTLQ